MEASIKRPQSKQLKMGPRVHELDHNNITFVRLAKITGRAEYSLKALRNEVLYPDYRVLEHSKHTFKKDLNAAGSLWRSFAVEEPVNDLLGSEKGYGPEFDETTSTGRGLRASSLGREALASACFESVVEG